MTIGSEPWKLPAKSRLGWWLTLGLVCVSVGISTPVAAKGWDDLVEDAVKAGGGHLFECVTDGLQDYLVSKAAEEIAAHALGSTPAEKEAIRRDVRDIKSVLSLAGNIAAMASGEPFLMCTGALGCLRYVHGYLSDMYSVPELSLTRGDSRSQMDRRADELWRRYLTVATDGQGNAAARDQLKEAMDSYFAQQPHLRSLRDELRNDEKRAVLGTVGRPFVNFWVAVGNQRIQGEGRLRLSPEVLREAWKSGKPEVRPQLIEEMVELMDRHPLTYYGKTVPKTVSDDWRRDYFSSVYRNFGHDVRDGMKSQIKSFSKYWNSLSPAEKRIVMTELAPAFLGL